MSCRTIISDSHEFLQDSRTDSDPGTTSLVCSRCKYRKKSGQRDQLRCRPRFERSSTGYEDTLIKYFYMFEAFGREPNWEQAH